MAAIRPERTGQRSVPQPLNLSSNNPFRNRTLTPSPQASTSPFDDPPPRPLSRNPFLDPDGNRIPTHQTMTDRSSTVSEGRKLTPEDLFDALILNDNPPHGQDSRRGVPPSEAPRGLPVNRSKAPGRENVPPSSTRAGPSPTHRLTRSQEEALRARKPQGESYRLIDIDTPASPQKRPDRRPRRNSDSSVMDSDRRPVAADDKKERDARHRDRKHRDSKEKRSNRKLDIIDQLDATSIFGTGLFHHDGPFDALNPHRNRNGSRRAPMQAFPKDSLNNVIGGSGPLNTRPDHATFLGQADEEAFRDYATATKERQGSKTDMPVFDPLSRGLPEHGSESLGLGTSTFLEGTPAARTAIRREEEERAAAGDSGLQRKKSLAQRIRNINRGPRDFQASGRVTSPEGAYPRRSPSDLYAPTSTSMNTPNSERNPFFQEYDTGKNNGEYISVRKNSGNGEARIPAAPRPGSGLERRMTSDAALNCEEVQAKQGSGLLARVKSLKGGRRARPSLPDTAPPAPPGQAA